MVQTEEKWTSPSFHVELGTDWTKASGIGTKEDTIERKVDVGGIMFCLSCGSKLAEPTSRCPACSSFYVFTGPDMTLTRNPELREKLLQFYLNCATSQELSEWLHNIGQDSKGTTEEKRVRVRQHTKYLSMTPQTFPLQTIHYLSNYTGDHLYDLCQDLGLDGNGSKNMLFRRSYREVPAGGARGPWGGAISCRCSSISLP